MGISLEQRRVETGASPDFGNSAGMEMTLSVCEVMFEAIFGGL